MEQWKAYCEETGKEMPSAPGWGWADQQPIANISWTEAVAYCSWLSRKTGKKYRLPTEAEWEYAAKGGKKSKGYKYSGSQWLDSVGWFNTNCGGKTHPVAQKKPNELGLYDMSGNVVEWCQDWFGPYSPSPQSDPQGPGEGSNRVQRGGSWSVTPQLCSVSIRFIRVPALRNSNVGFRLARSL
ncbi:MAG: formylglycine-generating enzyme family protein [Leadbetterella sp.]|nr:formylglycine-generating enzyme family protein [Leadbetterella sp.]